MLRYIIVLKGIVKGTSSWIELNRSAPQQDKHDIDNEVCTVSDEIYQGMKREDAVLYFGNCSYKPNNFAALKVETVELIDLHSI